MNCCSSKLNYIKLSAISVYGGLKLSLLTKDYNVFIFSYKKP